MEWFTIISICSFVIALWVIVHLIMRRIRYSRLMAKYNDETLVAKLMRRNFWEGQTAEQLRDSLGRPLDIDQNVLKTKVKEVWKYKRNGKNRYKLRVIIENGLVVGWKAQ